MPESEEVRNAIAPLLVALDGFIDNEKKALSQEAGSLLLEIDHQEARDAFETRVANFTDIQSVELSKGVLKKVTRRVLDLWPLWLAPLDPRVVRQLEEMSLLDAAARKLWDDSQRAEPPDEKALQEAAASLARLDSENEFWDRGPLTNEIVEGLGLSTEVSDYTSRDSATRVAQLLASAGILSKKLVANALVESWAGFLRKAASYPSPLLGHISRWTSWVLSECNRELGTDFLSALKETEWVSAPEKETILLHAAATLRQRFLEIESPVASGKIIELAREFGNEAEQPIASWLVNFASSPEDAWQAIEPFASAPSSKLLEAIEAFSASMDRFGQFAFLQPAIAASINRFPNEDLLRHAHIRDVDPEKMSDLLIELYQEATNLEARERVLRMWDRFQPLSDVIRKRLILNVMVPFLATGKQALDVSLRHLGLCSPPPYGTATALRNGFRENPGYKKNKKRVDERLIEAGLIRRRGLLGRKTEDVGD